MGIKKFLAIDIGILCLTILLIFFTVRNKLSTKTVFAQYAPTNTPTATRTPTPTNTPTATLSPTPFIPNCLNLTGPTTLMVGQTYTYTSDFTSPLDSLTGQVFRDNIISIPCSDSNCRLPGNIYKDFAVGALSGSSSWIWTPGAGDVGAHTISCRAFYSSIAECRPPSLVDGPPRYPCAGPNYTINVNVIMPSPTPSNAPIYGWVMDESNNAIERVPLNETGPFIGGYAVEKLTWPGLLSLGTTDSANSQTTGGYAGNYLFNALDTGEYYIKLQVTPTGSVLWQGPPGVPTPATDPQIAVVQGSEVIVDFPFVTVTATPVVPTVTSNPLISDTPTPNISATPPIFDECQLANPPSWCFPTFTPSPTVNPDDLTASPTNRPTPTDGPTPAEGCQSVPEPALQDPPNQFCTNLKPQFSANVSDPNNGSEGTLAWAHFFSGTEFSDFGSFVPYTGGLSTWNPTYNVLNNTGTYWWSAYTESSVCPGSTFPGGVKLDMDYYGGEKPTIPSCTLSSQSLITGECTFNCSWPSNPEPTLASSPGNAYSCSDTGDYHPIVWYTPGTGAGDVVRDLGWQGNSTSVVVSGIPDGQNMYIHMQSGDFANPTGRALSTPAPGNLSNPSDINGPFVCPKINFSISWTPTPTSGLSPTPTSTLTPTPSLSPTPADWLQVKGGDVYQRNINYILPTGQIFLNNVTLTPMPNSAGTVWSQSMPLVGSGFLSYRTTDLSNPNDWLAKTNSLSSAYNYSYYKDSLRDKAVTIAGKSTVAAPGDLNESDVIYEYSDPNTIVYNFDNTFVGRKAGPDVTILLVDGALNISGNINIPAEDVLVLVVDGNIIIDGSVTSINGLLINNGQISINSGPNPITINGMFYTYQLITQRTYRSDTDPAYTFIYQPKYMIALLPYLGRQTVNWQEVGP